MGSLEKILENKFKIFQLVQEWGFSSSPNNEPSIYIEKINSAGESRICLIVKTDPILVKTNSLFLTNEKFRLGYLEDELKIEFNCDWLVRSHKNLKGEEKNKTLGVSKNLAEDNKILLTCFKEGHFIRDIDENTLNENILSEIDISDLIWEFKNQIALNKYERSELKRI